MFWVRNEENSFPIHTLIWRPVVTVRSHVRDTPKALCCVIEKDTVASAMIQSRNTGNRPNMTEKLLTQI